jgi:hypothetical protein
LSGSATPWSDLNATVFYGTSKAVGCLATGTEGIK